MDRSKEKYDIQLERSRNWKKNNPERHAELARAYRERNKEKTKAQNLLNYAVRKGKIERGTCESCGTSERVHAHHHDYSKPYDVKWLCIACHKKTHPVDDEDKAIKFSGARRSVCIGEDNNFSTLDNDSVLQIRQLLDIGLSQQKIARAFGIAQSTVSRIKLGLNWSHIK